MLGNLFTYEETIGVNKKFALQKDDENAVDGSRKQQERNKHETIAQNQKLLENITNTGHRKRNGEREAAGHLTEKLL